MSRTLSTKCGSPDSLNVSERCGCKPKASPRCARSSCARPLSPGHRAQRPMGGVRRRRAERPLDNLGHLTSVNVRGRSDEAHPTAPRCAPSGSGGATCRPCARARRVRLPPPRWSGRLRSAGSCGSDRRSALDPAASSLTLKIRPLLIAQNQRRQRPAHTACLAMTSVVRWPYISGTQCQVTSRLQKNYSDPADDSLSF